MACVNIWGSFAESVAAPLRPWNAGVRMLAQIWSAALIPRFEGGRGVD